MSRKPSSSSFAHTQREINRLVGRVSLELPADFRKLLDQAVDEGLRRMPEKGRAELKSLITAQVALTMRATRFAEVLEKELERERSRVETRRISEEYVHLERLKSKYKERVDHFVDVEILPLRNRKKEILEARARFYEFLSTIPPEDAGPLFEWATDFTNTALKLRGGR